jgi:hypothetical protein
MSVQKTGVPLLKGSSNYNIWAIKIKSYLIRKGLEKTLKWIIPLGAMQTEKAKKAHSDLVLHYKSGPALHIQHNEYARPA